jgi:hypothetical protein
MEREREDDGRWLAEVVEVPGVFVYGMHMSIMHVQAPRQVVKSCYVTEAASSGD